VKKPKVTIIMATFNRAQFIVESLHSIINQTYALWECLIIDDGGTDNTKQIINEKFGSDDRFKFLKRPNNYNKGIPGCRNYGIDNATGDYLIFFDDDDIVHPQNLEICLEAFQKEQIDFCVYEKKAFFKKADSVNFQQESISLNRFISMHDIDAIIMNTISIGSCNVMWEKKCFNDERFNKSLLYAEEWECYPRIISNNKNGLMINNTLYYNRKHQHSNTGQFYANDTIRVDSKKLAISLLVKNLSNKNLLSLALQNYLSGLAISLRDKNLLNDILIILKPRFEVNLYLKFKFYVFPVWRFFKKIKKQL